MGFVLGGCCMFGFYNVWVFVCVGYVRCGCVCLCGFCSVCLCVFICEFCNMCVCVCVAVCVFVMCLCVYVWVL